MCVAHLEPLPEKSYLIRVGGEGWEFGEPYDLMMVVVERGLVAEIKGLDKPVLPSHWRAIHTLLKERGFQEVVFDRHRGDRVEHKRLKV